MKKILATLVLSLALLAACAPAPAATTLDQPTTTPAPTEAPKATVTPVQTPSPTAEATDIPSTEETPKCEKIEEGTEWWTAKEDGVLLDGEEWMVRFKEMGFTQSEFTFFLKWEGENPPTVIVTPLSSDGFMYDPQPRFVTNLLNFINAHKGVYAHVIEGPVAAPSWTISLCPTPSD